MTKLSRAEREVLEAFERGEFKPVENVEDVLAQHRRAAEAAARKDARIDIRLSMKDLHALQSRALREGVPYQTLVASVLHKYVDGQLVEKGD